MDRLLCELSEYASALPKLEKARYTEKLVGIKCHVDSYIDETFSCGSLPLMGYMNIIILYVAVMILLVTVNQLTCSKA